MAPRPRPATECGMLRVNSDDVQAPGVGVEAGHDGQNDVALTDYRQGRRQEKKMVGDGGCSGRRADRLFGLEEAKLAWAWGLLPVTSAKR